MESIAHKIDIALAKSKMNRSELAEKIGKEKSNLSLILKRDTYKTTELEKIALAMGYELEISFIHPETKERI
jgi:DNA-binding Xre family transcriptional regulator